MSDSAEHALRESMKGARPDENANSAMPQKQLKPYAAKVLMKILYAALYARLDLLRVQFAPWHNSLRTGTNSVTYGYTVLFASSTTPITSG